MRLKAAPERPLSVLVVDDEELVRKFVERVLREAGYQTATAGDGPEALEVAAKLETFDILVTDVMMPQMTGDELARRLRAATPGHQSALSHRLQRPAVQGKGHALGGRGVSR